MKTLKDYENEYKVAEEEASKKILWHDITSLEGLVTRLEDFSRKNIEEELKQKDDLIFGDEGDFENEEEYIEHYSSAQFYYWWQKFENRIDMQLKYTNVLKLSINSFIFENEHIFKTRYENGLKEILSEFFSVFTNSVFYSFVGDELKFYFGVQTEDHYKIFKNLLVSRMNLEFALCGERDAKVINHKYSDLSKLTQVDVNWLFSYDGNVDFQNRKYFFREGVNHSYYNTLQYLITPRVKAMERIKLPQLSRTKELDQSNSNLEITSEYKENICNLKQTTDVAVYVYFLGQIGISQEKINLDCTKESLAQYEKWIKELNYKYYNNQNYFKIHSVKTGVLAMANFIDNPNYPTDRNKYIKILVRVKNQILQDYPKNEQKITDSFLPYFA